MAKSEMIIGGVPTLITENVSSLLTITFRTAAEIQAITQRTKTNRNQCERLNNRIQIIAEFLRGRKLDDSIDQAMKMALANFNVLLEKCREFVNKFNNAGSVKRLWNNKTYDDIFRDLHTELSQFGDDLNILTKFESMYPPDKQDSSHTEELRNTQNTSNVKDSQLSKNIFISGIWKYQYELNGTKSNSRDYFELHFDMKNETFKGSGKDELGCFKLNGIFSKDRHAIEMNWSYEINNSQFNIINKLPIINNEKINMNYPRRIYLQWNQERNVFSGLLTLNTITDIIYGDFEMVLCTPSS